MVECRLSSEVRSLVPVSRPLVILPAQKAALTQLGVDWRASRFVLKRSNGFCSEVGGGSGQPVTLHGPHFALPIQRPASNHATEFSWRRTRAADICRCKSTNKFRFVCADIIRSICRIIKDIYIFHRLFVLLKTLCEDIHREITRIQTVRFNSVLISWDRAERCTVTTTLV